MNAHVGQQRLIVVVVAVIMVMVVVSAFGYKDAAAQRASKTNGQ
jgi:hypothetical protein